LPDGAAVVDGRAQLPQAPGIGFENKRDLRAFFDWLET
jgi:L-alanine-DL-glutamate epimerase-like enolase superfamily enzyme